jgi:NADPH:quinone reductase-like Zn-dependent oxidoreductase
LPGSARSTALSELGADHVVDVSGPDGIDHVVDFVGAHALLAAALPALRPGATLCITSGEGDPAPLPVRAADMVRLELNLLGCESSPRSSAASVELHAPVDIECGSGDVAGAV